jgi:hypothetical protein
MKSDMKTVLPLPLMATVKAAYKDVFGNLKAFLGVIWLILLMMVLFVEIPTLIVTQEIYKSMHPEIQAGGTADGAAAKITVPPTESSENQSVPSEKTDAKENLGEENIQNVTMDQAERIKPEHLMIIMALNIFQMAMIFSFSVAWYRQLLLNDKKDKTVMFHFGKDEWNFALTAMKSGFVLAPVVLVMMSYFMASIPAFAGGETISLNDNWWLFAGGGILMLYLMARLSMGYPLTVMGQHEEPIKQSWLMTKQHAGRILLGSVMMSVPVLCLAMGIVIGLSLLLDGAIQNSLAQNIPAEAGQHQIEISFAEHILFKTIGATFLLFLFGLASAFYARIYAFLVRSSQVHISDSMI